MDKTFIELYEKGLKNNVTLTFTTLLSDAAIEIKALTWVWYKWEQRGEYVKRCQWVPVKEMRESVVDAINIVVDDLISELVKMREAASKGDVYEPN